MGDIIFEYVPMNESPGYGIWEKDVDGTISLIGFCPLGKMGEQLKSYQDKGHHVIIRREASQ
jgi:hypothetical protein